MWDPAKCIFLEILRQSLFSDLVPVPKIILWKLCSLEGSLYMLKFAIRKSSNVLMKLSDDRAPKIFLSSTVSFPFFVLSRNTVLTVEFGKLYWSFWCIFSKWIESCYMKSFPEIFLIIGKIPIGLKLYFDFYYFFDIFYFWEQAFISWRREKIKRRKYR